MDLQALLDVFPGCLEENRLAPARHIPFLHRWVERNLAAPYDPALRPDDRLLAFLDKLARNAVIADWQVHQAEDAIRLFRQFVATRQAAGADAALACQRPAAPEGRAADPPAPLLSSIASSAGRVWQMWATSPMLSGRKIHAAERDTALTKGLP